MAGGKRLTAKLFTRIAVLTLHFLLGIHTHIHGYMQAHTLVINMKLSAS